MRGHVYNIKLEQQQKCGTIGKTKKEGKND